MPDLTKTITDDDLLTLQSLDCVFCNKVMLSSVFTILERCIDVVSMTSAERHGPKQTPLMFSDICLGLCLLFVARFTPY